MYEDSIGERSVTRDVITETPARRMVATIDREGLDLREGDPLPPMWHWLYFHDEVPTSDLGPDGHTPWNGLLAPPGLPRRMFAGGSTEFHRPLLIGSPATRTETIKRVEPKTSRTGAPLLFVTVLSEVEDDDGPVLTERRSIVYTTPAVEGTPKPGAEPPAREWNRVVTPSEAMLFRFSALTWNAHRIHYDAAFATGVDGHPALVVHGPLTAILLLDLWSRHSEAGVGSFFFRAMSPAYVNREIRLTGGPSGDLVALDDRGVTVMQARVDGSS